MEGVEVLDWRDLDVDVKGVGDWMCWLSVKLWTPKLCSSSVRMKVISLVVDVVVVEESIGWWWMGVQQVLDVIHPFI